jgi:putative peptidoglycan lipid II flippase
MSKKLIKSTAIVSAMTILSRILGFVRDIVLAQVFGAKAATDAFFVAFKIPNFMRRLFAEGAFAQSFVPVLSETKATADEGAVKDLVDHVTGTLGLLLLVITVIGILLAPVLIMLFAPGFILTQGEEQAVLASTMLRITFPYLLFISLTALAGGILNTYGRFAVPAFTPVLLNLCMISAAVLLAPHMDKPVMALAWGVLAAGIAQLLFQFPFLRQIGMVPRPRLRRKHAGVSKIMKLMLPALFGSSVAQINLLLDTVIASFLAAGSVSWLYYSDRLVEFPLGVFGIALATVILPNLSSRHAESSPKLFSMTLDWALRWGLLIGLPATVGLFMLAPPMIVTLFQYGEFNNDAVLMTSLSLMAYSLGLVGFIMVKVLVPGFFARQDTRTPVRIGIIAVVANMLLNIIIVVPMAMSGATAPHAGLALATSCSSIINASLLFKTLKRTGIYQARRGWPILIMQIIMACTAMGFYLLWAKADIGLWLQWGATQRVWNLAMLIAIASLVYITALLVLGARPWRWRVTASESR